MSADADADAETGTGQGAGREQGMVLYWRPGCPFCINLRLQLRFTRLRFTKVDIWQDPDAAAYVRSVADGSETVPTVTVAGHPMVNPSRRQILAEVRARAPHLLA